jgi:homoserine O-acetyltransferase
MDYYDLSADHDGVLASAFQNTKTRFCVVSFTSDWLYTTDESRHMVRSLNAVGARVSFADIDMDKGHDSFLLDGAELNAVVGGFLNSERGVMAGESS